MTERRKPRSLMFIIRNVRSPARDARYWNKMPLESLREEDITRSKNAVANRDLRGLSYFNGMPSAHESETEA